MSLQVKLKVFMFYVKAVGYILSAVILFFNVVFEVISRSADVWLSKWTNDVTTFTNGTMDTEQRNMRLFVYAGIGVLQGTWI